MTDETTVSRYEGRKEEHEIVVERIVLISRRDNTSLRWRGFLPGRRGVSVDVAGRRLDGER